MSKQSKKSQNEQNKNNKSEQSTNFQERQSQIQDWLYELAGKNNLTKKVAAKGYNKTFPSWDGVAAIIPDYPYLDLFLKLKALSSGGEFKEKFTLADLGVYTTLPTGNEQSKMFLADIIIKYLDDSYLRDLLLAACALTEGYNEPSMGDRIHHHIEVSGDFWKSFKKGKSKYENYTDEKKMYNLLQNLRQNQIRNSCSILAEAIATDADFKVDFSCHPMYDDFLGTKAAYKAREENVFIPLKPMYEKHISEKSIISNLPTRPRNFNGDEDTMTNLDEQLLNTSDHLVYPAVICGSDIEKETKISVEYAHRKMNEGVFSKLFFLDASDEIYFIESLAKMTSNHDVLPRDGILDAKAIQAIKEETKKLIESNENTLLILNNLNRALLNPSPEEYSVAFEFMEAILPRQNEGGVADPDISEGKIRIIITSSEPREEIDAAMEEISLLVTYKTADYASSRSSSVFNDAFLAV